jgi:hypothetical protein
VTGEQVEFTAELFEWHGEGAWHFVRLPVPAAEEVREGYVGPPRGFGSIRVRARVGGTTWGTSVFPDKESGSFLLPVKKPVREAECLLAGDEIRVALVVDPDGEGAP